MQLIMLYYPVTGIREYILGSHFIIILGCDVNIF